LQCDRDEKWNGRKCVKKVRQHGISVAACSLFLNTGLITSKDATKDGITKNTTALCAVVWLKATSLAIDSDFPCSATEMRSGTDTSV
jgi:hypothetical protein